ncbi:hypothetical protein TUZN_1106 [Thermoproteus uzoniensis 768-20]|uniref:DUF1641 domain-containing protein n=1 Tax=Thermoproteus uzoniensis (strain 768-20) TaxID=999630 RepID=F2L0A4_THEU7|nr:DUF1641 domain-containing protein [Thermoproteus uzoniensis]AEA12586.1 hypothetical protein TUZN_1106 [Thermoproteus uzoniensis 768-20]
MSEEKFEKLVALLQQDKALDALISIVERLDVVKELVDVLFEFKRSGVLDDLLNAAASLRFFTEGLLTRDFVEKLAKLQEVALVAGTNLATDSSKVDCLTYAIANADNIKPMGLWGLLSALQDPEVRRGLGYLVAVLKKLGSCRHLAEGTGR